MVLNTIICSLLSSPVRLEITRENNNYFNLIIKIQLILIRLTAQTGGTALGFVIRYNPCESASSYSHTPGTVLTGAGSDCSQNWAWTYTAWVRRL